MRRSGGAKAGRSRCGDSHRHVGICLLKESRAAKSPLSDRCRSDRWRGLGPGTTVATLAGRLHARALIRTGAHRVPATAASKASLMVHRATSRALRQAIEPTRPRNGRCASEGDTQARCAAEQVPKKAGRLTRCRGALARARGDATASGSPMPISVAAGSARRGCRRLCSGTAFPNMPRHRCLRLAYTAQTAMTDTAGRAHNSL